MGERKGQNKYYPPDFDPQKHGNLNRYHGTHALRERASKVHLGILTIRFEMPFNVWCLGCNNHIGMGVRYNAEKKKVGNYYSTPIYEFRMKCHLCDNYFEIKTDPQNFDYEMVSGLRRQEKRWDPTTIGQVAAIDRGASHKLATDAMYKLEHGQNDKIKSQSIAPQLEQLEALQDRMKDDYIANRTLRNDFRSKKKEMKSQDTEDDNLKQRSSLDNLRLVPEHEDDKKLATLLAQYRTVQSVEEKQKDKRNEIYSRPIFQNNKLSVSSPSTSSTPDKGLSKVDELRKKLSLSVSRKRSHQARSTTLPNLVSPKIVKVEKVENEGFMDKNETNLHNPEPADSAGSHEKTVTPLVVYNDSDSSDE